MSDIQQRIRELGTYVQLNPGDTGYVSPSSIYFPVDSVNFGTVPYKVSIESLLSTAASQKGKITNPANASVSVTFSTAFSSVPITLLLDVYRIEEVVTGKYVKKNVNYYLSGTGWLTTTGFSLTIDSSESLTGIIIEYKFEEI